MTDTISVLPQGHDIASFQRVLRAFEGVIGADNVLFHPERLVPYTKIMIPDETALHEPAAALTPDSVEQVQKILAICNAERIAVWPVSTGKNLGYGTAAPVQRGTLVLDLRRMNRILEFDPVLGTVLLEPGVTYRQLLDYIREHDHPFWIDVPGPGPIVGPVGQALERGIGYTPYGDHFGHACGFEIVLADGQVLRTGDGSIPGSTTFQTTRYGYGPCLDGLFTQSNFGVVTKMGLWLMPAPAVYKPFLVSFRNHADLARAVDICQQLRLKGVLGNRPVVGTALYQIAQTKRRTDIFKGKGAVSDAWLSEYTQANGMGVWAVIAALYGSDAQVAADWSLVKQAFRGSGGMVLTDLLLHEDKGWQHAKRQMAGELDLDEFGLYNWRGGGGSVWFAVALPSRGRDADTFLTLAKGILHQAEFDYLGGFMVDGRETIAVIDLLFDRSDPAETARAHACYASLMEECGKRGISVYRTNIGFMDRAAAFQGPVRQDVNRRIKQALDPRGILAPGKSGITI